MECRSSFRRRQTAIMQPDMKRADSKLGRRMAKGSIIMVLLNGLSRSVGLVSGIILARLLTPDDFGLVSLAMMITGTIQVVGQFGADLALIHDQAAARPEYDTAWTMQVLKGFTRGTALVLVAPFAAHYFDDERLTQVLLALAAIYVFSGFQNIGTVDFRKHLQYGPLIRIRIFTKLGAFVASIGVAVIWRTYWALIVGIIAERMVNTAMSYAMHPYRPQFSLQSWRKIMRFSNWIAINNILTYFNGRADVFILGRAIDTHGVGLYSVAKRFSNVAASEITMPAAETLFPGFAKLSADVERLGSLYVSSLALLLFVGLPVSVGVYLFGDLIVQVVLGEQWLPAVPLLKILAIYGIVRTSVGSTSSVMLALGKPHLLTALNAARFLIMVPLALWWVTIWGATGVAWAVVASAAASMLLNTFAVSHTIRFSVARISAGIWRVVISATVMSVIVHLFREVWPAAHGLWMSLAQLLALAALGATAYLASCAALWALAGYPDGPEKHVLTVVRQALARFTGMLRGQSPPLPQTGPAQTLPGFADNDVT